MQKELSNLPRTNSKFSQQRQCLVSNDMIEARQVMSPGTTNPRHMTTITPSIDEFMDTGERAEQALHRN
jgi:hypothetical protein